MSIDELDQQRLSDLKDNIAEEQQLLKRYEDILRYEDDPKLQKLCRREIQQLRASIEEHQQEYEDIRRQLIPSTPDSTARPRINFALLTAIEPERLALCAALKITDADRVRKDTRTYWCKRFDLPNGQAYHLILAQAPDMANVDAALLTADTINHWQPRAILMVGIAAATSADQKLGDLILGKNIYYYDRGKVTADGTLPEPVMYHPDPTLWDRAINTPRTPFPIGAPRPDRTDTFPSIYPGVIASGERVIADAAARDDIARGHRKIKAIEMEGYGVSVAAFQQSVPCLVIRALCDYADGDKNDTWHEYAAAVAAGFTVHFLSDIPLECDDGDRPPEDRERSLHSKVIECLWSLNYRQQIEKFEVNIPRMRNGAVVAVQAPNSLLQFWLVKRLLKKLPEPIENVPGNCIIISARKIANSFEQFLQELETSLKLDNPIIKSDLEDWKSKIQSKIIELCKTKNIVLIIKDWSTMLAEPQSTKSLRNRILTEFWQPLMQGIQDSGVSPLRYRLVLCLMDEEGGGADLSNLTEEMPNLANLIQLSPLTITCDELERWILPNKLLKELKSDSEIEEFLACVRARQQSEQQSALNPEEVIDEICRLFGLIDGFEEIRADWRLAG